jgi:hypothetical protein
MRLVAENIAFLELSDDQAVDSDTAVRELETVTAQLQQLSVHDQGEFVRFVRDVLAPEAARSGDQARAGLFSNLASDVGLTGR